MALLELLTTPDSIVLPSGSFISSDRYTPGITLGGSFPTLGTTFTSASSQSVAVIHGGQGYVYASSGSSIGSIIPDSVQPERPISVTSSSIAFISADVLDSGTLIQGLQPGVEVHILQSSELDQSIQEITQTLAGRSGITSMQIFSHGSDGSLQLGNEFLNASNLASYSSSIASWSSALTPDADLLVYGCNLAESDLGKDFVQQLGLLTGADIGASIDLTGSLALGANWTLEYATGKLETPSLLEPWTQNGYQHLLATFNVTNTNDSGVGSLRQAVIEANAAMGADTISFTGTLADQTPDTIVLTTGQLTITDALVIAGPGAGLLTINANNASRVFQIIPGVDATIANVTIANGSASDVGGGIVNSGSLAVINTTFNNNISAQVGGAIANFGGMLINGGTFNNNRASIHGGAIYNANGLEARNSNFNTNQAGVNGGGIYNNVNASLTVDNDYFSRNTAGNDGGGIYNSSNATLSVLTTVIVNGSAVRVGGGIANFGTISSIDNSLIRANRSLGLGGAGGGIFNGGTVNIINTSILSNTAVGPGGGIFNGGSLTLRSNSLVSSNRASNGGGIFNGGIARVGSSSILSNRLTVANGTGPDVSGTFISEGFNTIYRTSGSTGFSVNFGDTIILG
jgi:Domain of unknown function (DUF4347)